MLVEFNFSGFRSFKEEVVFSMEPLSLNGLNSNVIETNLKKVPQLFRTSALFGANASGKSNFIQAFSFVRFLLLNSSRSIVGDVFPEEFYALGNKEEPMSFSIKFISHEKLYSYHFKLSHTTVLEEGLSYADISKNGSGRNNRLFERINHSGKISFEKSKGILQSWSTELLDNRLLLSDMINNRNCTLPEIKETYNYLCNQVHFLELNDNNKNYSLNKIYEGQGSAIIDLVKKADLGLENISVKAASTDEVIQDMKIRGETITPQLLNNISSGKLRVFETYAFHKTEDGQIKSFNFNAMESAGTTKFLSVIGYLLEALDKGWVMFSDELDTSLHPTLLKELINLFNNPKTNPHHAQLIFTSHAPYLMDGEHLTRDQIWFVSKEINHGLSSSLYSLSDLKIDRKNISFYEAYMNGVYGSIPKLEDFSI